MADRSLSLFGWQIPFVFDSTDAQGGEWGDYVMKLGHGGRGSGKTRALLTAVIHYCSQWPGALIMFATPTYKKLNQDVLPVLWEILSELGLQKGKDYKYWKDDSEVELFGCKIFFRTTEDPEVFRGPTAAAFAMDEAALSPLRAFMNLQGTLRQRGYPHHAWLATTPAGRTHWLCKLFYPERAIYGTGEVVMRPESGIVNWKAWPARTRDNPFGGEELYQSMISTYGEDSPIARQELNGEFVSMEGLVYDTWSPDRHVVPFDKWPERPGTVVGGIDFGFTNPAAIIIYGMDSHKRRYIMDEFYRRQVDEPTLVETAKALQSLYDVRAFFADSADPGKINALRRGGLRVYKAFKKRGNTSDLSSGIGLCYRAVSRTFSYEDDGVIYEKQQGLYVDPRCTNFRREIDGYTYDNPQEGQNPKERPRLFDNHALDAWRYAEAGVSRIYDPVGGLRRATSVPISIG